MSVRFVWRSLVVGVVVSNRIREGAGKTEKPTP